METTFKMVKRTSILALVWLTSGTCWALEPAAVREQVSKACVAEVSKNLGKELRESCIQNCIAFRSRALMYDASILDFGEPVLEFGSLDFHDHSNGITTLHFSFSCKSGEISAEISDYFSKELTPEDIPRDESRYDAVKVKSVSSGKDSISFQILPSEENAFLLDFRIRGLKMLHKDFPQTESPEKYIEGMRRNLGEVGEIRVAIDFLKDPKNDREQIVKSADQEDLQYGTWDLVTDDLEIWDSESSRFSIKVPEVEDLRMDLPLNQGSQVFYIDDLIISKVGNFGDKFPSVAQMKKDSKQHRYHDANLVYRDSGVIQAPTVLDFGKLRTVLEQIQAAHEASTGGTCRTVIERTIQDVAGKVFETKERIEL